MTRNRGIGDICFTVCNTIFMCFIIVICLYPLYYVIMASLSSSSQILRHSGLIWYPLEFTFEAYTGVFKTPMILRGYKNTLIILTLGLSLNLLLTSLGAYFLSRKNLMWKNLVMTLILVTMYINGGLVPTYLNLKELGMYNNFWALTLPFAINTFNLIIMRTSFMALPDSLEESAVIDGANDFHVLFKIILPLSMPVVAVMALYYGVAHWNAWFYASLLIRDKQLLPLQVILREILIQNETAAMSGDMGGAINIGETIKYATIVVSTLPILCVYPFLQKYFAKGVMIGAVKG